MVQPSDDSALGLERFLYAQVLVYDEVVNELRLGKKQTHWMCCIFPRLVDLGRSVTARQYGIVNLQEACDCRASLIAAAVTGQISLNNMGRA